MMRRHCGVTAPPTKTPPPDKGRGRSTAGRVTTSRGTPDTIAPDALYHFTCKHSKAKIGTGNCLLIPQIRHPLLGCKVTWLTTEAIPDREATGLGSHHQRCERMEYRYVVDDLSDCRPWLGSAERQAASRQVVETLEEYGDVEHWWITDKPIRARFDRTWSL